MVSMGVCLMSYGGLERATAAIVAGEVGTQASCNPFRVLLGNMSARRAHVRGCGILPQLRRDAAATFGFGRRPR